jgi:hypothetical protein
MSGFFDLAGFFDISTKKPFTYEAGIKYSESVQWFAFWLSMIYVVVIFGIKAYMTNRKPYSVS